MDNYSRDLQRLIVSSQKDINVKYLKNNILQYKLVVELDRNLEFKSLRIITLDGSAVNKLLKADKFIKYIMPGIEEDLMNPPKDDEDEIDSQVNKWKNTKALREELRNEKVDKEIQKPPVEVMAMKQKQLEVYFPALIDTLYQKEGVKRGNKWAVKNKDGVLTAPDPPCPNWHDGIVDPIYNKCIVNI